jgi:hypothetical protein
MSEINLAKIEKMIYLIRGQGVMLDSDLAELYGVETKAFNQAVKRNLERFPSDFMFQLTEFEAESLRSQFVTSKEGRGGRRYLPFVFTENGVAMISSILNSKRAIQINITIMRTFVRLRSFLMMAPNKEVGIELMFQEVFQRLDTLEEKTPILNPHRKKISLKK